MTNIDLNEHFPGIRKVALEIGVFLKLDDPDYFGSIGDTKYLKPNVVKEGLMSLPNAILHAYLKSDCITVVATHSAFKKFLEKQDYRDKDYIKDVEDERIGGTFFPAGSLGEQPTLIILEHSPKNYAGTTEHSRQIMFSATIAHEVGHAIDDLNGWPSLQPYFKEAYKQYNKHRPEKEYLYGIADRYFVDHCKHGYDPSEEPPELVAELISKYTYAYNLSPQIAEATMNIDFPYVWHALKEVIPQIEQSLLPQKLDSNARPLFCAPEAFFALDVNLPIEKKEDTGDTYISVFGMSKNEVHRLEGFLKEHQIETRKETLMRDPYIVFDKENMNKLNSLKTSLSSIVDTNYFETLDTPEFALRLIREEDRLQTTLKEIYSIRLPHLRVRLGYDETVLVEVPSVFDYTKLPFQDISEDDKIYTSAPGKSRYAIPFDRLPKLLTPDLSADAVSTNHTIKFD